MTQPKATNPTEAQVRSFLMTVMFVVVLIFETSILPFKISKGAAGAFKE